MFIRPFAYNAGTTISGATQIGDLSIGTSNTDYSTGVAWWTGPDEELGFVICGSVPTGDHPTRIGNIGTVHFWRTLELTDNSMLELTSVLSNGSITSINDIQPWLITNNYWSSWGGYRTTTWIGNIASYACQILYLHESSAGFNGYKFYGSLKEVYVDNGDPTGITKFNTVGDLDYIAPDWNTGCTLTNTGYCFYMLDTWLDYIDIQSDYILINLSQDSTYIDYRDNEIFGGNITFYASPSSLTFSTNRTGWYVKFKIFNVEYGPYIYDIISGDINDTVLPGQAVVNVDNITYNPPSGNLSFGSIKLNKTAYNSVALPIEVLSLSAGDIMWVYKQNCSSNILI